VEGVGLECDGGIMGLGVIEVGLGSSGWTIGLGFGLAGGMIGLAVIGSRLGLGLG